MAKGRGRRALMPATRKKHGSSRHLGLEPGVEESRRFKGTSLAQVVVVEGAVAGWTLPKAALSKLLKAYLAALGLPKAGLVLRLTDDAGSQSLNRSFRGIDAPTDILSFPAEEAVAPGFAGYLGDLALDLPYAWRKRGRFHSRFEGEAAFLLLHGLLHLAGQHHDTAVQERALWKMQDAHFPPEAGLLAALRGLKPKA
jgi:probable rRNA maturation factor